MLCMPRLRKVCRRCGYLAHARSSLTRAIMLVCATPTHGPSFSVCCSLQTCSTPRCAGTALAPSASAHSIYTVGSFDLHGHPRGADLRVAHWRPR